MKVRDALAGALILFAVLANNKTIADATRWNFDSIAPEHAPTSPEQTIYDLIMQQTAAWNAHDLEGFMAPYWQSPRLVVVIDGEQALGWEAVHQLYVSGYADRNWMGFLRCQRVQIQMLRSDLAFVLLSYDMLVGKPATRVVATSTLVLQRFASSWKIIAAHSNSVEP